MAHHPAGWQHGELHLRGVLTCRFGLDGGAMFGVVPRPLWSRAFLPDDVGRIALCTRSLVIDAPRQGRRVVVDVGCGSHLPAKLRDRHALEFPYGDEAGAYRQAGIDPDSVSDVIVTHLHFDHAAGLVRANPGAASYAPLFAHARHHVQRRAWEYRPGERDAGSFVRAGLDTLATGGRLQLHDGPCDLFPGLRLEPLTGHSPGMQVAWVGHERPLLYAADLIPTAAHLPLAWIMAYDLQPLVTLEEKRCLLGQLADRQGALFLEHDPRCAVLDLRRAADGALESTARAEPPAAQ